MRVGVLTGGGDVPGLNPCIKAFVNRVDAAGHEVLGIRRGWAGLLHYEASDPAAAEHVTRLDPASVRTIDRSGGTALHTSRTNPGGVRRADVPPALRDRTDGDGPFDFTDHVLEVIEQLEIDALVPIGGDDTLAYALRLHDEGVPVIAIPKTMDNDVHGTDYCIGFSTAVTRGVQFIHDLRTSAGSHERLAVIELFGRYSGETSLITAYLAGVDRAVISEVPFDPDRLAQLLVADKRSNPSRYAMVTVSEGATAASGELVLSGEADAYGHRKLGGIGQLLGEALRERTGEEIIYQQLAYLMRSGSPDSLDLMVATNYAVMAADLALEHDTGRMVSLRNGSYTTVPISATREGIKRVDVDELYDTVEYRPKIRHVLGKPMFLYLSIFGVLTGGGDCPGLNAAIRAAARGLLAREHDVVGIRNGWRGLVDGTMVPLTRRAVAGILPRGGTILGTSGYNPFREESGVETMLATSRSLNIEGVVAIGGEGTLIVAHRLHAEHGYPVVGVPKTIDNDLAGTDVTIGFDTAVHVCTEAIDRLHTTAESHNRVMVIEVMGRNTGWIAAASGVAGGADVILVPEVPTPIEDVCDHVRHRHDDGKDFSIVVVAEGYPLTRRSGKQEGPVIQETDDYGYPRLGGIGRVVADEITRHTGFETRVTVLGHVQRGGTPTARDRLLATRLGLKAAELAVAGAWGRMAAIHGNEIVDVSLREATEARRGVPSGWIEAGRIVA